MTFTIGQRVRCIDVDGTGGYLKLGEVYTVAATPSPFVENVNIVGVNGPYLQRRFEPWPDAPTDMVEVIGDQAVDCICDGGPLVDPRCPDHGTNACRHENHEIRCTDCGKRLR